MMARLLLKQGKTALGLKEEGNATFTVQRHAQLYAQPACVQLRYGLYIACT